MTAQWYFAIGGRTHGPVTGEDLRQRASRGEIGAADLVWRDGMSDWVQADALGLATTVTPPPLPGAKGPDAARSGASAPPPATPPPAIRPPATDPVAMDPVASPPTIGPPRLQRTAADVDAGPAPARSTRDRDQYTRQSSLNPRATRTPAALRAVWWLIGIVAILACGFWVGRSVGRKSSDETSIESPGRSVTVNQDAGDRPADSAPSTTSSSATVPANPASLSEPPTSLLDPQPRSPGGASPPTASPAPASPYSASPRTASPALPAPVSPAPVSPAPASPAPASPAPASPAPVSPAPVSPAPAGEPAPADQGPHIVFQTLEIHRKPTFVVQGMTLPQELRYRIISRLEIAARAADGSRKVVQIVESTHLDHADDLSRATFAKSLAALQRQQYTFKLNEHQEVIEFSGPKKNLVSLPLTLPDGKGLQLTSVIDEDGWKELAQFTFFQPDERVAQGQAYVRQITHDWSPLGTWSGTTTYTADEVRRDLQSISFRHALTYTPPAAKDAAGPLGFRVVSAECTIDRAEGTIQYDRQHQRVTSAQETFHVHGIVSAELLGQPVNIQMQEQQLMTIRVSETNDE